MPIPVIVLSEIIDDVLASTLQACIADRFAEVHVVTIATRPPGRVKGAQSVMALPPGCRDADAVSIVRALARRVGSCALLPVRLPDVAWIARNRDQIADLQPVPVPDLELLETVSNKRRFIRLAQRHGLPVPATVDVKPPADTTSLSYPILVKPAHGEGGWGVKQIDTLAQFNTFLAGVNRDEDVILQSWVPGEDAALTLLADQGEVFAVATKRRWFHPRGRRRFLPCRDWTFYTDEWIEDLGRRFVAATGFSGIADFDLRIDDETRRAWFLECDPRMMGSITANRLFGLNVPRLLVERVIALQPSGHCIRNEAGHFLSFPSAAEWIRRGAWRTPRHGPLRMNWRAKLNLL